MPRPRYTIGIDLGTTNCAVAFVDTTRGKTVETFAIPQLVGEASVAPQVTLPSFLYLAGEHDVAPGALALPWDPKRDFAVGTFARLQGTRVPGRLVSSAKSWLCHGGVDRTAAILPWGAPAEVRKLSPVDASARYLAHIREAWNDAHPEAPLEAQDVVLTVPASFDEVARELTVAAAAAAGIARVWLLEEPQAAFYAWLSARERDWRERLDGLNLLAVIDIGGGTTDFSLIAARRRESGLALERLAVGDHLLLGGDNIDIALARLLEPQLGGQLDSQRWHALTNLCRTAKETLLGDDPPDAMPIHLVGRGRSVVGGVLTATLLRGDVERAVIDGFFPLADVDAVPRRTARAGLQEWGLPFASEPEVSRHLAAFLRRHRDDQRGAEENPDGRPDAILFNGGALKPALIRNRLRDQLARWYGAEDGWQPAVLESVDLDLAVARGAAYYGLVRRGLGVRIGGGAARSYYLGISAAPGVATAEQVTALCLVRRGMEEGEEIEITDPALDVLTNRGVSFPLYASSTRTGEHAGQLVTAERDSLTELPPIRTVLRFGKKLEARKIPVHVLARLTEVGTLEVWCRSLSTEHRWRLQFQLREQIPATDETEPAAQEAESVVGAAPLQAAVEALRAVFPAAESAASGDPVGLVRVLEERLGTGKDAWPLTAIRKLWDALWEGHQGRTRSPQHETRWLNLSGFLLRPGFGAELDDWRTQQLWKMKSAGLRFARAAQCRAEWWNMWKRIAGGLTRQQQLQLHTECAPWLLPRLKTKAKGPKPGPQEIREYWQLMASCERLSAEAKAELGNALLPLITKGKAGDVELWALGRLGARAPFHGPLNCVVARSVVAQWVEALLATEWQKPEATMFALVQLARRVGDRERDLDEALRQRVAQRIEGLRGGRRAAQLVTEIVPLEGQERARILDESLPAGLQIRADAAVS
ncbi:MAG TPA: Hsp70 family protein [Candidatus Acidoferrales bacterium]|nr:Hsp70 family protein [Candidatus Acidoferrales bacterium]